MATVLKKSLPLILTSFVNKCGNIGLSLLPMLLVERAISSHDSSIVMALVKSFSLIGTLVGGLCCDRFGLKNALMLSFLLNAIGLGFLAVSPVLALIIVFACLAQLGSSMFPSAARLLITQLAHPSEQQEAIGWLRTANNIGHIVSYGLGATLFGFGIPFFMILDALTALGAIGIGAKLLPSRNFPTETSPENLGKISVADWQLFFICALTVGGYSFLYDLFMVGASARSGVIFGDEGLRIFSQMMLVNTILCAFLAVPASRFLKNPRLAFPAGILLSVTGLMLTFAMGTQPEVLYTGAFFLTLGEVCFMALSSFVLIRVTPNVQSRGTIYGGALVIQHTFKILGASLAFPMLVHGSYPGVFISCIGSVILGLSLYVGRLLKRKGV